MNRPSAVRIAFQTLSQSSGGRGRSPSGLAAAFGFPHGPHRHVAERLCTTSHIFVHTDVATRGLNNAGLKPMALGQETACHSIPRLSKMQQQTKNLAHN